MSKDKKVKGKHKVVNKNPNVYVINGIGHCGTTLVYLFSKNYRDAFQKEMITDMNQINDIKIERNCTFKTHTRYPIENHPGLNVKTLYMFGDVYNIVPSYARRHTLHGKPICSELLPEAKENLNIVDDTDRNFFDYDVFKFKEHFDNWNKPSKNKVMLVRYENMYKNLSQILKFLDIKDWKKFPQYKKRKTDWRALPISDQKRLEKTYGETREYFKKFPDIIVPKVIR